jgi:hypothetical protein
MAKTHKRRRGSKSSKKIEKSKVKVKTAKPLKDKLLSSARLAAAVPADPTGTCIVTTPMGSKVSGTGYTETGCKEWASSMNGTGEWIP